MGCCTLSDVELKWIPFYVYHNCIMFSNARMSIHGFTLNSTHNESLFLAHLKSFILIEQKYYIQVCYTFWYTKG